MPESDPLRPAELLADLGRYEEAAAELAAADAADPAAQTLLSRIRLAAGEPRRALAAAESAVAAAPTDLPALTAHGMALAALGRVDEAATAAERLLRHGRGVADAYTSAAAILADVRAGQMALDAAWEGVRIAADQPRAHLVLGVVAARLGLDQLAARAYEEALALDPRLPDADAAVSPARREQHWYAAALSHLAPAGAGDAPRGSGRHPGGSPVEADDGGSAGAWLRRLLRYGAGYWLAAPLLVAAIHGYGRAGLLAAVLAGLGAVGLLVGYRRLPQEVAPRLGAWLRHDRRLAAAGVALLAAPVLLGLFAVVGSPWLLVATGVAGLTVLLGSRG